MSVDHVALPGVAEALRSGRLSLQEYIDETLKRIDEVEPKIQALVPEEKRRTRLMGDAEELCRCHPDVRFRPPLFGVLVGVKDLFRVEGLPTRAGSKLPARLFVGREASVVSTLKKAGALILGKTVTTEFAYFEPGPTRNPRNLAHTPGGSSSGSAASIAANYCAVSLGTQTIGSITRPAAYCGVVGVKPSFGRVACDGMVPFSASMDQVGFFTHHVEGIFELGGLLCSDWQHSKFNMARSHTPILGIPEGAYLEQANKEVRENFERQVALLEAAGYTVVREPLFDDIEKLNTLHRSLVAAEFAAVHKGWFAKHKDLYGKASVDLLEAGKKVSAATLNRGRENRSLLRKTLSEKAMHQKIDLWISPSTVDEPPQGISSTGSPVMNLPWTHAGVPTVSIPAGKSTNDLPFGIQIAGSYMQDELLIGWVESIGKAMGFK